VPFVANNQAIKNTSRYLAVKILEEIELEDAYSNLLLRSVIDDKDLSKEDTNLLTELVYGTLQRQMTLDYLLEPFLKKQKNLENWVRQILRLSVYQMEFLDRVPDHAIINEAANIAKDRGHRGIVGLVNGVLRNVQRTDLRDVSAIKPRNKRLSIQYSLPLWLVDEFIQELGPEEAEKLVASFIERPKLSLRVNLSEISREEALEQLQQEGYQVEGSEISPFGIIALNGVPVDSTLFEEGLLSVQDESSMLVAPALAVEPHHHVLDACAAPGGKAMHLATNFLDKAAGGQLEALDVYEHKIDLIDENAKRQQVTDIVQAQPLDARNILDEFAENTFDRILIDAPCSGLGLIRRRPEIRYNKTKADILSLKKLQQEIIENVSKTLKPGGQLIYSTCTITSAENNEVVQQFLDQNKVFTQETVPVDNGKINHNEDGSITIYPHQYDTDGFFIAKMTKNDN